MKNFLSAALGFLLGCALGAALLTLVVFLASCHEDLDYDPRQEPDQTGGGVVLFEQVFIYPHETN